MMKIVRANIGRTVVTRVILAWAALGLPAGAVVFYVELGRFNRSVFELTANESKRFTEHIKAIGPEHVGVLETLAKKFLQGDFISLRRYDANKKRFWKALPHNWSFSRFSMHDPSTME